jgi:tryptophanyl-tRNA synthetase
MGAFTTPTKIRKTDPGVPEGCAVCQYMRLYVPGYEQAWDEDRRGERGCMQSKKELIEALNEYLRPMRERRATLDDGAIDEILQAGAEKARDFAADTMRQVRAAMRINPI